MSVIEKSKLERFLNMEIKYVHSKEYETLQINEALLDPGDIFPRRGSKLPSKEKTEEIIKELPDELLDPYILKIKKIEVLTAEQERFLFRRYNYYKYLAVKSQKQINRDMISVRLLGRLQSYLDLAQADREKLILCNLRLVFYFARKFTKYQWYLGELISEGNMALIYAIDNFDYSMGWKLSTYAIRIMASRFASLRTRQRKHYCNIETDIILSTLPDLTPIKQKKLAIESAREDLIQSFKETLKDREWMVISEHYGIASNIKDSYPPKKRGFREIGKKLGVSHECVRYIEHKAINKLRKVLQREDFKILHG